MKELKELPNFSKEDEDENYVERRKEKFLNRIKDYQSVQKELENYMINLFIIELFDSTIYCGDFWIEKEKDESFFNFMKEELEKRLKQIKDKTTMRTEGGYKVIHLNKEKHKDIIDFIIKECNKKINKEKENE